MTLDAVLSRIAAAGGDEVAVIGAHARNAWAPPRATTDLDLVVSTEPEVLRRLDAELQSLGYACVRKQSIDPTEATADLYIYRSEHGDLRQIDLLVAKTAFEAQALAHAVSISIGDLALRVVRPEDLIVYKLLANRPRDRDDIEAVLRAQDRTPRAIDWSHIREWSRYWGIEDRLDRYRADAD